VRPHLECLTAVIDESYFIRPAASDNSDLERFYLLVDQGLVEADYKQDLKRRVIAWDAPSESDFTSYIKQSET